MPSLGSRESRALLVFFGGALVLFVFFAVGAYVGRWARSGPNEPQRPASAEAPGGAAEPRPAAPAGPSEYFLVEVAVVNSQGEADALLAKLRQQYISAFSSADPTNPALYSVYVGPYPHREQADTVRAELAQRGMQPKIVRQRESRPGS